jgi:hypothetical protein
MAGIPPKVIERIYLLSFKGWYGNYARRDIV